MSTFYPSHSVVLENVKKHFTGSPLPAVSAVNLCIRAGMVTGLIGPDGAGKTTLLRMICGLLRPDSGQLCVCGLDPVSQVDQLHAVLGYMPQKFGLYEDLSVMENLLLYADLRGISAVKQPSIIERLLNFTDLSPFTGRLTGKLSGGMKQKLALACTLIGQPRILLLDEPSVGVDPIARCELWQMIHSLADEGMLILWSTSYLDEAEQCAEVILLNEGKLLYSGIPDQLTQRLTGRSVLLHVDGNDNRRLFQRALSLPQVSSGAIEGQNIRLILKNNKDRDMLLAKLSQPTARLQDTAPRFEDAFIELLGGSLRHQSELARILPQVLGKPDDIVIEAQQLTKKFADFIATDNINFQIKRGEIFGLLGPNGAGKSTTFKMICGLLRPTHGKALILGMDLNNQPGNVRQRFGYMSQKFALYGNLTVQQNLQFFSGIYGLRGKKQQEKIHTMVEAFNLGSMLNQTADVLSLGFKQRLALSCSLMHEPDILFLDEPTSGVDPLTRREFWAHINGMVNKGVTIVVTTHFMDEAEYCDRIGLVYQGKIMASGSPDALKQQARGRGEPELSMEQTFIKLVENCDRQGIR